MQGSWNQSGEDEESNVGKDLWNKWDFSLE